MQNQSISKTNPSLESIHFQNQPLSRTNPSLKPIQFLKQFFFRTYPSLEPIHLQNQSFLRTNLSLEPLHRSCLHLSRILQYVCWLISVNSFTTLAKLNISAGQHRIQGRVSTRYHLAGRYKLGQPCSNSNLLQSRVLQNQPICVFMYRTDQVEYLGWMQMIKPRSVSWSASMSRIKFKEKFVYNSIQESGFQV